MSETPEVENQAPAPLTQVRTDAKPSQAAAIPMPIDVITVEPQPVLNPDAPEIAYSSANRVSKSKY